MNTQKGKEVYELMKMGAIDGLSVGYRVDAKGYHYDERGKRRMLKEVDTYGDQCSYLSNESESADSARSRQRIGRFGIGRLSFGIERVVSFQEIKSGGKRRFKGFRPARGWR